MRQAEQLIFNGPQLSYETWLQELERQKRKNLLAAPPPDHWLEHPDPLSIYYLPLPLDGTPSRADPPLDASVLHEMQRQV